MLRRRELFCLVGMVGLSLGLQNSAVADLALQLSDATFTTSIPISTTSPITFSGPVGEYNVQLTAGSQTTSPTGKLEITNLTVTRTSLAESGNVLTINLAANNYNLPVGSPVTLTNALSGTFTDNLAGASVTYQTWGNSANTLAFATGTATPLSSFVAPTADTGAFAGPVTSTTFTRSGNFALNSQMIISLLSTMSTLNTTGTSNTRAVPEPASTALTLTGLPFLGLLWARRRRQ